MLSSSRTAAIDGHPVARARLMMGAVWAAFAAARLRALEPRARQLLVLTLQNEHPTHTAWVECWLGHVYYEWNDLDAALEHYGAVVERRDSAHFFALRAALQGLALTTRRRGERIRPRRRPTR